MGAPSLADAGKWGAIAAREAARDAVDGCVTDWTSSRTRDEVLKICEEHQVPCGPVYAIDEIFADPQFQARRNIAFVTDARAGEHAIPNVVPQLSETPGRIDSLGPALGAHNAEIFGGLLGLSRRRMAELQAAGVI